MNTQLKIIRALALLGVIPGLGVMSLGVGIGLKGGGLLWLLGALVVFLGSLLIWKSAEYFRRPTRPAAADLLTVISLMVFGFVSSQLQKFSAAARDLADRIGIDRTTAEIVRISMALLIAWTFYRILKRWLLKPAVFEETGEKIVGRV